MQELIKHLEKKYSKEKLPQFSVGDTVKVYTKFREAERVRTQIFEGIVIAKRGSGTSQTFRVRKISYGEGVEKVFPLHSPLVEKVKIVKYGSVRRAKLYYLRKRIGKKATRVREKVVPQNKTELEDRKPSDKAR